MSMLSSMSLPRLGFSTYPGLTPPRQERQVAVPPLDPATEESLLSRIGGSTLSGLAAIGNTLDTPASIIRGLLMGDTQKAFGGILDPSQRVWGVDLLGMPHDTSLFSAGGAAGLGAEILLDPLTYLTFGGSALTKLGKTARKAGVLPRTTAGRIKGLEAGSEAAERLARFASDVPIGPLTSDALSEVAGKPLGSVAKWGPLNLGSGQGGLDFLSAASAPFRGLSKFEPIDRLRRGAVAAFDPSVQESVSRELQPFARQSYHAQQQVLPQEMTKLVGMARQIQDAGVLDKSHLLRPIAEQVDSANLPASTRALMAALDPGARQVLESVGGDLRVMADQMLAKEQLLGGNTGQLRDAYIEYLTRHMNLPSKSTKGYASAQSRALGTFHPEMLAREEALTNLPGGSAAVEEIMGRSGALGQMPAPEAQRLLREEYLWRGMDEYKGLDDAAILEKAAAIKNAPERLSPDAIAQLEKRAKELEDGLAQTSFPLTPERRRQVQDELTTTKQALDMEREALAEVKRIEDVVGKSRGLLSKAKGVDPRLAQEGKRYFRDPFSDVAVRISHHVKSVENMDAVHNLFVQYANDAANIAQDTFAPKGFVSLDQAYAMAGMGKLNAETGFGKANEKAVLQFLERSQKAGRAFDPKTAQIPRHIAEDAGRLIRVIQSPEALEPWLKLFDQATNLFKVGNTFIWPAYHVRNLFSSMSQNMFTGNFSLGSVQAARDLHFGNIIKDANKIPALRSMSAEEATKAIADVGVAHGLLAKDYGPQSDIVGRVVGDMMGGAELRQLPGPGVRQAGPLETLGQGIQGQFSREGWNPLEMSGIGSNVDRWGPGRAGRQIASQIDELGTMSAFIHMLQNGWSLDAAAQAAKAIHYRGARFTSFEQGAMRRLVPFYWWVRNNTEFIGRQLFERPGGSYAQAFRAGTRARGSEPGFLPDWLGQNVVAKIGEETPQGTQKFVGSLGLPFEDVPSLLTPGGTLGVMNPMLKAPLEMVSGKQFFSGRDLADLRPYTGSTLGDQVLFNSPLARATRYVRQAGDPRKTALDQLLNFGTGLRITDVDMGKAKDLAVRDYINESLRGRPNVRSFENLYVREQDLQNISPQDLLMLRLQASRRKAYQQRQQATVNPIYQGLF